MDNDQKGSIQELLKQLIAQESEKLQVLKQIAKTLQNFTDCVNDIDDGSDEFDSFFEDGIVKHEEDNLWRS